MLNTFQQYPHALLPTATHDEASRQEFAKSLKQFVQQGLLPGLQPAYRQRAAKQFEATHGREPRDRRDIREAMTTDVYFQHYAAVNRISQEHLWNAVIDSVDRQLPELNAAARRWNAASKAEMRAAVEIAQKAYNDDMGKSVCNFIRRKLPDFRPRRILDLGCTVGHSTLPFKTLFPDAEVWGIDVGAPVVRYAHARAAALGVEVNFAQMNAEEIDFEDGSFDLIVSHILLHETCSKAMPRIFRECHRLLAPGGYVIHADLPPFELMDPFTQFILDNETWYNNEPFWGAMREVDQIALAVAAGFERDRVHFSTAPMAIMEAAAAGAAGYTGDSVESVADREFVAGEYAPGGGWEVLVAQKAPVA